MKLIDILVEELPKRGGWPEGAARLAQDPDGDIQMLSNRHAYLVSVGWTGDGRSDCYGQYAARKLEPLASDYDTAIITREQYEAALAAKNDGWIEWGGGKCPVEKGTLVDVRYRDSQAYPDRIGAPALVGGGSGATYHHWLHDGMMNDIISYRLHNPQEAGQAKADDETDLNECIEQGATPVWNGEGLPPVGVECEWQDNNTKQWIPVKVVYSSEWVTVIREINEEKGDDLVEIAIENYGDDSRLKFRPLRTEAEQKRDAVVEQMIKIATIYTTKSLSLDLALNSIYNAIAAGEIPSVKLEGL